NANISMSQSILTKDDLKNAKIGKNEAIIGQLGIVAKKKGKSSISAQFLGIKKDQFIYQDQDIIAGKKAKNGNQITVDSSFKDKGYKRSEERRVGKECRSQKEGGQYYKKVQCNI